MRDVFGGNDTLIGDNGDDYLDGGRGDDSLVGNGGDDFLQGRNGNNVLEGGDGNDTMNGSGGEDTLSGGDGNDLMRGQGGDDTLNGGDGNDRLDGGRSADVIDGGAGNDTLRGDEDLSTGSTAAPDTLIGGEGSDIIYTSEGDIVDLSESSQAMDELRIGPGIAPFDPVQVSAGTGTADQSLAVAVDGIVVAELASLTAADIPDLTIDAQWNTVAFGV